MKIIINPDELTEADREAVTTWYDALQRASGYILPCALGCNTAIELTGEGQVLARSSCRRSSIEATSQVAPPVRPGAPGVTIVSEVER